MLLRAFFRLLLLFVFVAAFTLGWAAMTPMRPAQSVTIYFPARSSTATMASALESNGVIRSAAAFRLAHLLTRDRKLKAGEYRFEAAASTFDVLRRIERGDVLRHSVVVPEGYNLYEIAAAVEKSGLGKASDFVHEATTDRALISKLDPSAPTLEGYLFPDTYLFPRGVSMREIASTMVHAFERESAKLDIPPAQMRRVVTLASIVEKETAAADERAHIAGVYQNRLDKNMALGADPTVIYAALVAGRWRGTIYESDLHYDSPYNTYKRSGLPPGPIANPGREALRAALHPLATNDLYFVAVGDGKGHHRFAATAAEHDKNVAAYRAAKR